MNESLKFGDSFYIFKGHILLACVEVRTKMEMSIAWWIIGRSI